MKFGTLFLNGLRHLICFTWTFAIWNRKKASRFLQSLLLGRNIWFGTLDISAKGLSFGSEDMTLLCTARLRNQCMLCRCFSFVIWRGASLDQYCPQWFQMKAVLFQLYHSSIGRKGNQCVCISLMMTELYHWWEID